MAMLASLAAAAPDWRGMIEHARAIVSDPNFFHEYGGYLVALLLCWWLLRRRTAKPIDLNASKLLKARHDKGEIDKETYDELLEQLRYKR